MKIWARTKMPRTKNQRENTKNQFQEKNKEKPNTKASDNCGAFAI